MPEADLAGAPGARPPHDLALGAVALRSRDPDRLMSFYEAGVGLAVLSRDAARIVLGAGGRPLVEIRRADAAAPARAPGLFHLAIRVPDRAALAARLVALHGLGRRIGASDHRVSEAIYVDDPDGNGIEIYVDRPRAEWPRTAQGGIAMATLPLDLSALLREAPAEAESAPAGTDMGHVHLKVADLEAARRFWVDLVGLAIMARYPGALFVSADGYHHHLGLNTWQSAGAARLPAGAAGLDHLAMVLPQDAWDALADRLAAAGWPFERAHGVVRVADPSGNTVWISAAR